MKRIILLALTHAGALAIGFAAGIFYLPILTAEAAPEASVLEQQAASAEYSAELTRDLRGSDGLHWGEGTISVSETAISHQGELSPGPDYKVYLTKEFVEDEAEFEAIKADAVRIGDVKSFDGFLLDVPEGVDVSEYTTVVVWCETFGEFITAGQYR
ncbi:DM13 domain-containing protein [Altererythrobacter lutimaris]|uniref:DM13 domain-containing protein n=1 Tax=Altererythrobacter lutimaris TaxID=2743979 RepID=A0A850HCU8_9SPHN|nr:DM13 domain-containing protein [Altererythrobacter lutimaris]NVE95579.1 DM13 domain-containing protein [Altererythrobacter lutimaris]